MSKVEIVSTFFFIFFENLFFFSFNLFLSIKSILLNTTNSSFFNSFLPRNNQFVRVMPNMPSMVEEGVSCLVTNKNTSKQNKNIVTDLFGKIGKIYWLSSEKEIDKVTAISGSGPGYYFLFIDLLEKAAVKLGFTRKIANYKFTTLNPNLGVAVYDDKEITLADIPGIIEGAHTGIGLGIKFLKHIERCKTLIHLIDITEENLENLYKQVRNELGKYSKKLLKKDELVIFNKIDLIDKSKINEKKNKFLKKIKKKVLLISTFDKTSIKKIKSKLIKYVP